MIQIDSNQWLEWLNHYFWPLLRVLARIMTVPVLSERSIPKRIKIVLGIIITVIITPSLPVTHMTIFFDPRSRLNIPVLALFLDILAILLFFNLQ